MLEANGWLVIDGIVMAQEFRELADRIASHFSEGATPTGREIFSEFDILDHSDIGGWKNQEFGGKGEVGRASFRFLEIIAFAAAESLVQEARAAGCDDEDDKDKEKCRAGTVILSIENDRSFLRVGQASGEAGPHGTTAQSESADLDSDGITGIAAEYGQADESTAQTPKQVTGPDEQSGVGHRWFRSFEEINEIRRLIFPRALDRPVLLLDSPRNRILLFEPSRQSSTTALGQSTVLDATA
jgi:hypothetical protein